MRFGEKVQCRRCSRKFKPPCGSNLSFAVCPRCRKLGRRAMGIAKAASRGKPHVAATRAEFHPLRGDIPGWCRDGEGLA